MRRLGPFAPTIDGGRAAARAFAEARSTAVVAYNDLIAIGFMQTMQSWGVAVPGDVSVVEFDDIFGADFCSPALTTVAALRVRESTGPRPRRQRAWTPTPPAS